MQEIGSKILAFLKQNNIDLYDLAARIDEEAASLKRELETEKIELKTIEKLSKELRIPLYSFFSTVSIDEITKAYSQTVPHYINRLTPEEQKEFTTLISNLVSEIEHLKKIVADKTEEIKLLRLNK